MPVNKAPEWAKGTFIWRINLPDETNALKSAGNSIADVANRLDRAVRQVVFINGAIGVDDTALPWDGSWPYWDRPTFRINHDWDYLARFMLDMRDNHDAFISFHLNITDVNVGLAQTPETRSFFERLRDNKCIYTREAGGCGKPWFGLPFVPREIPVGKARMPYSLPGSGEDIFALVDYKQLWDTGIAREIIDRFLGRLPYPPPLLYLDVLSAGGCNLGAGYPDGPLGHSYATQLEGRGNIISYLRSRGVEVASEGVQDGCFYCWSHGGLSNNDYSRIASGFGQGGGFKRGSKPMQVYGNQGGFLHQAPGRVTSRMLLDQDRESGLFQGAESDHIREWCTVDDIVAGFYLAVIQELYHMGKGNVRLPGGAGTRRTDEEEGRVNLDCYHVRSPGFYLRVEAASGTLSGTCSIADEPNAYGGRMVVDLDLQPFNANTVVVNVPAGGEYELTIRYSSMGGGTAGVHVNGRLTATPRFPDTAGPGLFGDLTLYVNLEKGENTIRVSKDAIHAEWDDGTRAAWDNNGFRAWNGRITFGAGFDRMWPDTWNAGKRIYFFSWEGTRRSWTLPEGWTDKTSADLYLLTGRGRGQGRSIAVTDNTVSPLLEPRAPYVLIA